MSPAVSLPKVRFSFASTSVNEFEVSPIQGYELSSSARKIDIDVATIDFETSSKNEFEVD
jgi:hypothetical protein